MDSREVLFVFSHVNMNIFSFLWQKGHRVDINKFTQAVNLNIYVEE